MILEHRSNRRHPLMSLINILFLALAGMLISMIIGLFVIYLVYGESAVLGMFSGNSNIKFLKIIQLFISIGTFVLPAIIFSKQESDNSITFLKLKKDVDIRLMLIAIILTYCISPLIEWSIVLNKQMILPEFLKGLELWMRQKEEEAAIITRQFLEMRSIGDLLVNLLIIAVIPAIGEELLFRGCLQRIFTWWTKNYHVGIWIAAIIFSAIHVQFFGFLPRLFLGALFGYLFYWSGNLLIPILAHFINNGTQVVLAYFIQLDGKSIESIDEPLNFPLYMYFLSFVLSILLAVLFYKISFNKVNKDE